MRNWAKSRKNRPRGSMAAGRAQPVLTLITLHYFPNTAILSKTPALPIRQPPSVTAANQQAEPTDSSKPPPSPRRLLSFGDGFLLACTAGDAQTQRGAGGKLSAHFRAAKQDCCIQLVAR